MNEQWKVQAEDTRATGRIYQRRVAIAATAAIYAGALLCVASGYTTAGWLGIAAAVVASVVAVWLLVR